jgi:hypothetical protein
VGLFWQQNGIIYPTGMRDLALFVSLMEKSPRYNIQ